MIRWISMISLCVFLCAGCASESQAVKTNAKTPGVAKAADGEKNIETDEYGCRIERYRIHSPSMDKDIDIAVVLPPDYGKNPQKRYPVVYTLHGARAPYDTFANMPRFRKALAEKPMIYTCFEGQLSSYVDAPNNPKSQYETFFFDEFAPYIDKHYRTNGQRGVGGFSMGGGGAMHYALKKPEMFDAVCVLSTGFRHYDKAPAAGSSRRGNRFGDWEKNKEFYKSIDAYQQVAKHVENGAPLPAMMLRCGTEDPYRPGFIEFCEWLVEQNGRIRKNVAAEIGAKISDKGKARRATDEAMMKKGINFVRVDSPGGHNWVYWHGQAPEFARFFWEQFQENANKKK